MNTRLVAIPNPGILNVFVDVDIVDVEVDVGSGIG
jgi:hypothetical protein